jgi:hypothetical protein
MRDRVEVGVDVGALLEVRAGAAVPAHAIGIVELVVEGVANEGVVERVARRDVAGRIEQVGRPRLAEEPERVLGRDPGDGGERARLELLTHHGRDAQQLATLGREIGEPPAHRVAHPARRRVRHVGHLAERSAPRSRRGARSRARRRDSRP